MLAAAGDAEASVRSAALYMLANSQDPRATQAIVSGMKDADPAVRASAAGAAGTQPADAVGELLMTLLDSDQTRRCSVSEPGPTEVRRGDSQVEGAGGEEAG